MCLFYRFFIRTLICVSLAILPGTGFTSFSYAQEQQSAKELNAQKIVEMPAILKQLWQQVPAESDILKSYLSPFRKWLCENGRKGDLVLIQGDFGATYLMVEVAFRQGLIPVYTTSVRNASEKIQEDGSVKMEHVFSFCRFRKYGL